jgi:hypothetical protein
MWRLAVPNGTVTSVKNEFTSVDCTNASHVFISKLVASMDSFRAFGSTVEIRDAQRIIN